MTPLCRRRLESGADQSIDQLQVPLTHGPAIAGCVAASLTARAPIASKNVDKSNANREEARGMA
jgi:hypothetical protein